MSGCGGDELLADFLAVLDGPNHDRLDQLEAAHSVLSPSRLCARDERAERGTQASESSTSSPTEIPDTLGVCSTPAAKDTLVLFSSAGCDVSRPIDTVKVSIPLWDPTPGTKRALLPGTITT